jgi:TLC domain
MAGETISHSSQEQHPEPRKQKPIIQVILQSLIEFKYWEILFKVLLLTAGAVSVFILYRTYQLHTLDIYRDINKLSIFDFKYSLLFAGLFFVAKGLCELIFTGLVKKILDEEKFPTEEDRSERAKKSCKWIFSIIYYTCSTIACYLLFRDQYFFPKMLGGQAECRDMFSFTPGAPPTIPYATIFYMVQFGCHLHTLVDHVIYKRKDAKFWEMFLHHAMAVFLIFFSYLVGEISVGILVLFTHDPADIFLDAVRFYNDLKIRNDVGVFLLYVSFMGVWIYTRLYAFPSCIVSEAMALVERSDAFWALFYGYLTAMLTALVALHMYWFLFIIRIAVNIVLKNKEYNTYDNKNKKEG